MAFRQSGYDTWTESWTNFLVQNKLKVSYKPEASCYIFEPDLELAESGSREELFALFAHEQEKRFYVAESKVINKPEETMRDILLVLHKMYGPID
jgi:hypothetical protein